MKPEISIIIPTRDEAASIAQACGATVLHSQQHWRGAQLQTGGATASDEILWFAHADTTTPPDAIASGILPGKETAEVWF